MTRLIATFFGVGTLPFAPGTWGSLVAVPLAVILYLAGGFWALVAGCVVVFLAGSYVTHIETMGADNHDPSEIVIDEVAGQWITLLPLFWVMAPFAITLTNALWLGIGFALFRAFDILKPGPVGWVDKIETPLGVMLDDVVAGVLAALVLGLLLWVSKVIL